jgi:thioredoxin 1
MTVVITEENFKVEVESGVTLIDFWAEWCGPCQVMLPILDELSTKMKGKAKIAKVNVDENPELASQFRVMSIPTLLVMKD